MWELNDHYEEIMARDARYLRYYDGLIVDPVEKEVLSRRFAQETTW